MTFYSKPACFKLLQTSVFQGHDSVNRPDVICDAGFRRWRHAQRLMHPSERTAAARSAEFKLTLYDSSARPDHDLPGLPALPDLLPYPTSCPTRPPALPDLLPYPTSCPTRPPPLPAPLPSPTSSPTPPPHLPAPPALPSPSPPH